MTDASTSLHNGGKAPMGSTTRCSKNDIVESELSGLEDPRVAKLRTLISESFRIRRNHDPLYVDFLNTTARYQGAPSIYIQKGEHKRLTYPF